MTNNLNVLVSDLSASQQNFYLISNVNLMHQQVPGLNIQVFCENILPFCIKPNFSVMNVSEAWGQPGPFVATNFSTAAKILNYPLATKRLFYVWDLEFLRGGAYRMYDLYAPTYLNKNLELVCRSEEHRNMVENAFNREVKHIIPNFNMNDFLDISK